MSILEKYVRLFRIHYINLTLLDNKELQNMILIEYYMLKNNFNRIGVGACYNNIGYLTFYMDSFELSKDMFTEAIKNSNQITAIGRSFNRSIAYYFLAENTSVEPEVKFEEAADSFED